MKRTVLAAGCGLVLAIGLWGAACRNPRPRDDGSSQTTATAAPSATARSADISLFITAQIQGTTEPCGCSSEPLGDVARIAALLKAAGPRGLLLDAGALRYKPIALPAEKQRQARLKADFLETTFQKLGAVVALQPSDLKGAGGAAELAGGTRLLCNVTGGAALPEALRQTEALRRVGGVAIGIVGIAAPDAAWPAGLQIGEPIAAAEQAAARLRSQGATAVIALTGLRREAARRLGRKAIGIDLVVAGGDPELTDGAEQAEQAGKALVVAPAIEGQRLVRVDLYLDPATQKPVWTLRRTPRQAASAAAVMEAQLGRTQARLEALRKDAQAEPAFVQTTEEEAKRLAEELSRLREQTAAADKGGQVTVELVPIGRKLPRDREVAGALSALDRRIGEANLESLAAPPPAPAGAASYVGLTGCLGSCHFHDEAAEFWQKTRHARAFPTLVEVGKELSYDCVGCHAVGFDEAGGSNLWSLAAWQKKGAEAAKATASSPALPDLRNVQCEVCHGPGSLHVKAPSKNPIPIARPTQERCLTCHTKDHSDTFDFVPYLRDIVGPGHGAEKRTALGSGPTGKELRSAALKKHQAEH